MITEIFSPSVAMFRYVFLCELRGPALSVGNCSISYSAWGIFQNIIYETLRRIALYNSLDSRDVIPTPNVYCTGCLIWSRTWVELT